MLLVNNAETKDTGKVIKLYETVAWTKMNSNKCSLAVGLIESSCTLPYYFNCMNR